MCKKLIIGIVIIFLVIILGIVKIIGKTEKTINPISKEQEASFKIEEVTEYIEKLKDETATEVEENVIVEKETEEKQKFEDITEEVIKSEDQKPKTEEALQDQQNTQVKIIEKQNQVNTPNENVVKKDEQENSDENTEIQDETKQNTEDESKIEDNANQKVQVTEEIVEKVKYNKEATEMIIKDINELAKQNPSLWDERGNKLYKIEISESLVGQNYMNPYRKVQVAGVVLNVFPVKFLVYAIDIEKDGFIKETRYYINVAEY